MRGDGIENAEHIVFGLSDGESPDRHSWQIEIRDIFDTLNPEIVIDHSLGDREESLWMEPKIRSAFLLLYVFDRTTVSPAMCTPHGCSRVFVRRVSRCTLIKRHNDICPEMRLDFHRVLRCEKMFRAIQMRPKFDSILGDFDKIFCFYYFSLSRARIMLEISERKHLKSPAISEDREIDIHKLMESTK